MKTKTVLYFMLLFSIATALPSCENNNQVLYRIQQDGLYGFIDNQGRIAIEPQYKYVSSFSKDGFALVLNQLKIEIDNTPLRRDSCVIVNYGYINKKNQRVNDGNIMTITPNALSMWGENELYKMVSSYNNGMLEFRSQLLNQLMLNDGLFMFQDEQTKLFGYKDIRNNIIIEPQFDRCKGFRNGAAIVFEPIKSITENTDFSDSLSFYRILNKCGAINTNGNFIIDYEYFIIQDFMSNETTWAMTISPSDYGRATEDWVCINKKGDILIGPIGSSEGGWVYNNKDYPIYQMDFGFLGTYYSFVDKNGNFLSDFNNDGVLNLPLSEEGGQPEMFPDVIKFSEGVAGINAIYKNKEGWFFVDKNMSVLSSVYDSILPFSDNMAAVKELAEGYRVKKWGFVKKDPSSNTIVQAIPFSYSECGSFDNGLAYFSNKGNAYNVEGYINKNGDIVWQTKRKNF